MNILRVPGWVFTVPGLPTPKGRPRVIHHDRAGRVLKKPRTFTPKATKVYEKKVAAMALKAKVRRISGPVYLAIQVFVPADSPADLDNIYKAIADGLEGIAYENDNQVWAGAFERRTDAANPRVEIVLMPFDPKVGA